MKIGDGERRTQLAGGSVDIKLLCSRRNVASPTKQEKKEASSARKTGIATGRKKRKKELISARENPRTQVRTSNASESAEV